MQAAHDIASPTHSSALDKHLIIPVISRINYVTSKRRGEVTEFSSRDCGIKDLYSPSVIEQTVITA